MIGRRGFLAMLGGSSAALTIAPALKALPASVLHVRKPTRYIAVDGLASQHYQFQFDGFLIPNGPPGKATITPPSSFSPPPFS